MAFPDALSSVVDAPDGTEALGGSTPSHTVHTQALVDAVNETQAATLYRARADEVVFDVVAYGAAVDGTTDDTAAWQDAIDACVTAGGGVVTSSRPGISVVAGALQDTSGANAQLTLPSRHYGDDEAMSITIRGPFAPAVVPSVVGATPVPSEPLVIKSTLASGTGAILGGYGPVGSPSNFTNVALTVEDVVFRTVSNPTISGLDLRRVANVHLDRVLVDSGSFNVDAMTEPSTSTSYGLRLPARDNGAHVYARQVDVVGFYTGVEFSEHANLNDVNAWGCKVGFNPTVAHHASIATRIQAAHCQVGIKFTGGVHAFDVDQFNIEHAAGGWHVTTYDVDDASDYGKGTIRWWSVLEGSGAHDSFTMNGGANLTEYRVGEQPAGGGGSTVYEYRDRLVAAAGNDTLTLGATPVTGSPLVWLNNVIKWPGTDYTISGAVATFGTPLSASDVVLVHYRSTASSASASTLTTAGPVLPVDNFNRADSTSSLGSTSTGSIPWNVVNGTWGISSNKAYISVGSVTSLANVESGVSAGTVAATLTAAANALCGLCVRMDGSGNGYVVEVSLGTAGAPKIYRKTGGTYTQIATGSPVTVASGSVLSVEMSGTTLTVKDDGVTIVSVTDATYSGTKHGLYAYESAARFDDFSVT